MQPANRRLPSAGRYRTIVVGAGPAGAMAAAQAAQAGPVLLIDASPLPRHKSCGGMIHDLSSRTLVRHGVRIDDAVREPSRVRFRFYDWDSNVRKPCSLTFTNVDRDAFDKLLLDALPANVEVIGACAVTGVDANGHDPTLRVRAGDDEALVECSCLIGADGARSTVRRAIAPPGKLYVTLQDSVETTGPLDPFFDCIYTSSLDHGLAYSYLVPKDGSALFGSVFYPGTKRLLATHVAMLDEVRERLGALGATLSRESSAAAYVRAPDDLLPGVGRILLAGEAGGFLSPTSGEGISYALHTGVLAGMAAAGDPDRALSEYRRALRPLMRRLSWKFAALPLMESRMARALARTLPAPALSVVTRHL